MAAIQHMGDLSAGCDSPDLDTPGTGTHAGWHEPGVPGGRRRQRLVRPSALFAGERATLSSATQLNDHIDMPGEAERGQSSSSCGRGSQLVMTARRPVPSAAPTPGRGKLHERVDGSELDGVDDDGGAATGNAHRCRDEAISRP